ncbi:MAG: hypothetical protein K8H86_00120 [Ignavibacteriaceae bacterium]|nr:hypothetical protein [Ignavibacteriaceae bacterium]
MTDNIENRKRFKFNMSFYYQSTIAYFVFFLLYAIIRGEFVEGSFRLITKDPIIYFFGIIVVVAILSLLYNLFLNKYLIIDDREIEFSNRYKSRKISLTDLQSIKITREKKETRNGAFRIIRLKLKNRKRILLIRPYDYENHELIIKKFIELKVKLGDKNV